jgi:hypothetical protein
MIAASHSDWHSKGISAPPLPGSGVPDPCNGQAKSLAGTSEFGSWSVLAHGEHSPHRRNRTAAAGTSRRKVSVAQSTRMMRWTAPHKASRCRRVIVDDESPERGRPCQQLPALGSTLQRRCSKSMASMPRATSSSPGSSDASRCGVLRQAAAVSRRHGGLRQCARLGA